MGKEAVNSTTENESNANQDRAKSLQINPCGETELFIAAEFIEQRYQGAPHLKELHFKDRYPIGTRWATMPINHIFHYGQNSPNPDPTYRYLVYHPFIRPRNIPQSAFAQSTIISTAKAITKQSLPSPEQSMAQDEVEAGIVMDLIERFQSEPLERFDRLPNDVPEDSDTKAHVDRARIGIELANKAQAVANALSAEAGSDERPPEPKMSQDLLLEAQNFVKGDVDHLEAKPRQNQVHSNFVGVNRRLRRSSFNPMVTKLTLGENDDLFRKDAKRPGRVKLPPISSKDKLTEASRQSKSRIEKINRQQEALISKSR